MFVEKDKDTGRSAIGCYFCRSHEKHNTPPVVLPRMFLLFVSSHLLSSPLFPLSLLVVTQIRGHIAGSFPVHATVRALHFYREIISALLFLRRLASNCANPRYALSVVDLFSSSCEYFLNLTNSIISGVRGLPLHYVDHGRGDRMYTYE